MTLHPRQVTFPGKSGPNFLASGEGANDASLQIRSEPLVGHFRVTSNSLWEEKPKFHKEFTRVECAGSALHHLRIIAKVPDAVRMRFLRRQLSIEVSLAFLHNF